MILLENVTAFEWDDGNCRKSADKHRVSKEEAEQVFLNDPLVLEDLRHNMIEARYHALGVTNEERRLHVTFTLRKKGKSIRIISARDMSRKERFYL